jgi:hypothetical protein
MTHAPKIPSAEPGEFIRDLTDERLTATLPRAAGVDDAAYAAALDELGLVVLLSPAALKEGGYPAAKAKAISSGVPLLVPYDNLEQHFNAERAARQPSEKTRFDYLEWKREFERTGPR